MKYRKLSYFDEFHCKAGECPENCCRGWQIPLAEEDLLRYRDMKGEEAFGLKLRILFSGKEPYLNPGGGKCPYLNSEGLCALQKKRGEAYLPLVCKLFPRRQINYGPVTEQSLFLSCVEAARLFLEGGEPVFTECEEGPDLPVYGDNDDLFHWQVVEESRDRILEALQAAERECLLQKDRDLLDQTKILDRSLRRVRTYGQRLQDASVHGKTEELQKLCVDGPDLSPALSEDEDRSLFPLSLPTLNRIMSTRFYQKKMKEKIPTLNRLCRTYFSAFDELTEREGQELWEKLLTEYGKKREGILGKYIRYLRYYYMTYYGEIFEDYSFVRRIDYGILHANMLLLMDICKYLQGGVPDRMEEARTLAAYEKRGLHSKDLQREMYKVFQDR